MKRTLLALALSFALTNSAFAGPLVYEGDDGPGKGTHVVLLAGDHEYRSEETIPALARILAHRLGFKCTVLFTVDQETGEISPGSNYMPGMDVLAKADVVVIFMRYQNLPKDQMDPFVAYLERGGPIVALRTSTHAFKIPKDSEFARFDEKYKGKEYFHGFGRQVLGDTWNAHYGKNHLYSTRLDILREQADHPIFTGIENLHDGPDMWVESGAYWVEPTEDCTFLATSIPLDGMKPTSPIVEDREYCPAAWTKVYDHSGDGSGRAFTTTYGASEDLLNEPFRRMVVNATFWSAGLEDRIAPDFDIDFVGPYTPTTFDFFRHRVGIRPEELSDLTFPVMPNDRPLAPGRQKDRERYKFYAEWKQR